MLTSTYMNTYSTLYIQSCLIFTFLRQIFLQCLHTKQQSHATVSGHSASPLLNTYYNTDASLCRIQSTWIVFVPVCLLIDHVVVPVRSCCRCFCVFLPVYLLDWISTCNGSSTSTLTQSATHLRSYCASAFEHSRERLVAAARGSGLLQNHIMCTCVSLMGA